MTMPLRTLHLWHVATAALLFSPFSASFGCWRLSPAKIIDACNKFNSHYPAKGMPPGIYAADNDVRTPMNNMLPFALGAVSCLFVVGSLITARWLRRANQWQPVTESEGLNNEVRPGPSTAAHVSFRQKGRVSSGAFDGHVSQPPYYININK